MLDAGVHREPFFAVLQHKFITKVSLPGCVACAYMFGVLAMSVDLLSRHC
jgi:hypothetical protein